MSVDSIAQFLVGCRHTLSYDVSISTFKLVFLGSSRAQFASAFLLELLTIINTPEVSFCAQQEIAA